MAIPLQYHQFDYYGSTSTVENQLAKVAQSENKSNDDGQNFADSGPGVQLTDAFNKTQAALAASDGDDTKSFDPIGGHDQYMAHSKPRTLSELIGQINYIMEATLAKQILASKSDLPPFLFSAEGDESGSAGDDYNDYDQLHQIFDVKVKRMHTILKKQLKMQDMVTMKTNLTNSGPKIMSNPEKGMDSFFVAVRKFFMEEYSTLEPSDIVTQLCVHLTYFLATNRFKFVEVIIFILNTSDGFFWHPCAVLNSCAQ